MKFGHKILFLVICSLSGYVSASDDNFSSLGALLDTIEGIPSIQGMTLIDKICLQHRKLARSSERAAIFNRMKLGTKLVTIREEAPCDGLPHHRQAGLPLSERVRRKVVSDSCKCTATVCWRKMQADQEPIKKSSKNQLHVDASD